MHKYAIHESMASPRLSEIDVRQIDVFAVSSAWFWAHKKSVALSFFAQLPRNHSGLLVAKDDAVCVEASSHSIPCAVSHHFSAEDDRMMMKERWVVLQHFLERRQRVVFAGCDVRFLRPLPRLFAASGAVDGAFDGVAHRRGPGQGLITHFTPDLIVGFPTQRMMEFVRLVLQRISVPRTLQSQYAGLPTELQKPVLMKHDLMGPAQQDALNDVFVSMLYNTTVTRRKQFLAVDALKTHSIPASYRGPVLRPLPIHDVDVGVVVSTPRLTALLTGQRMVRSNKLPCQICNWPLATTYALHCLGKSPRCLDIGQCRCLWKAASNETKPPDVDWAEMRNATRARRQRDLDGDGGGGDERRGPRKPRQNRTASIRVCKQATGQATRLRVKRSAA